MVETKTISTRAQQEASAVSGGRTFGAGYIAPHPSIRKDAVDVDGFLQDHQVYTREYLESVQPAHRNPTKWYEFAAWYWHVAARTMVGLMTGTWGMSGLTERSLAKRILFFSSVGIVSGMAAAIFNHDRSVVLNKPDNGWVHTAVANAECVRTHSGIWAVLTRPPLPARLFQLMFQTVMFFQMLAVYAFFPSVAHAYDAFRAEEQVFNYSQAIRLIDNGTFKGWKGTRAPGMAVSYYALPEGALVRDAVLRMRADEACIHHLNSVLADLNPGDKNPFIVIERKTK